MPPDSLDGSIPVNIKEFVDDRIREVKEIIQSRSDELVHRIEYRAEVAQTAIAVAQIAIKDAKFDLNARLMGMNEFRDAMKDQAASFVTRNELETVKDLVKTHISRSEYESLGARVTVLDQKVGDFVNQKEFDNLKDKMDGIKNQQIVMLIGVILALLAVVLDYYKFRG